MANSMDQKKPAQNFGQSALKYPEGWKFEIKSKPATRSPFADQTVERDPFYAEITFKDAATGQPHTISKSMQELNSIVSNLEKKIEEGNHSFDGRARVFMDAKAGLERRMEGAAKPAPKMQIQANMPQA